jgi:hypothetical protein
MNLEFIASLLQKDATELQGTLNLEEGQNVVPEELAKELLENHIKELSIVKLSEGKKQAEGMARKKVLSEAEKKLKDMFDVTGETYDDLVTSLKAKLEATQTNTDEQLRREKEALKARLADVENKLSEAQNEFQRTLNEKMIIEKLSPQLTKYEFATDKVKNLALQDYLRNRSFIVSDGDIYLEIDGKPVANMENDLNSHMLQFATIKQNATVKPKSVDISDNTSSFGNSISELIKALKTAPVEEREAIKAKIKQIEAKRT